ncbi:hypothetical protein GALMADRAFT_808114 [Galerina marginata CBS 339.88]|uniref:Novel STAND NTPase 1 domain-containing protein n=1 Tax=Galerina marginata (strain CBS 339.88) TaxID=685588 RepID=A0A067SM73_GALM3|nr:hypothetical protein GALMADRAFT_808114 [Galerina marginata CBS 339.88]
MVVIVANVTAKNENGSKEVVVKAAKGIEQDITGLLSTLSTINGDLAEIKAQNRWAIAFYKELNTNTINDCMNRLSTALERFKLANDLRDSELLQELRTRLGRLADKVDDISKDIKHVYTKVDNLADDFEEFKEIYKRSATQTPSETIARQQIPLKPEIFYGRDALVNDIAQLLVKEETSRVCILGPGGMGKTSVSLAVAESWLILERFLHAPVWVPCIGATSAALFLEILYTQLQVPGDKQVTFEKIVSELTISHDPRLIILDNFETPMTASDGTQKQVEDVLRKLAELSHVAFLVTMRGSHPPCHNAIKWQSRNIQPTDEEACLRIFHEINPSSKDDPDVSRLLSALGRMPFAVTLMANLGEDGQSTAKDLLDAWSESGPDMLSENREQSMNRSITLSIDGDLIRGSPNASLLLSTLSLLPAGTTKVNLHWWAPMLKKSMIPSAIATLSKAGLLVENKRQGSDTPVLFVVPVVQSFMQHNRIDDDLRRQIHSSCCQFVLDHACRYDDSAFPVKSKALVAEDTNIQSILLGPRTTQDAQSSDKAMVLEALMAFNWHRCDTKPNIEIASYAVTVAEASGIASYIASTVWCLGRSYYQLGPFHLSYEHLQKAYQIFDTLPPGDPNLQQLGGLCGIDFADAARLVLEDSDRLISLALDVEKKCASLSGDIHGRSLVFVGMVLLEAQRSEEALSYLNRGRVMLGNSANLAAAYQVLARLHYGESQLSEALKDIQEAWKQAEMSGSDYIQGVVSLDFGVILFSTNRHTEAWQRIKTALVKATLVGNWYVVALALEYMGYGYLLRGDYQNAYEAYEASAEKYRSTIDGWVEGSCTDNMTRIKEKLTKPDAPIGFYRPSQDTDKTPFYPLVQIPVDDVPIQHI